MKEKEFDILIDKYLNEELSTGEKNNVELWLHHITDHHAAALITDIEHAETEKRIYAKLSNRIKRTQQKGIYRFTFKLHPALRVAAAVLLCGILLFAFRNGIREVFKIEQYATIVNSEGRITKSILSDGSIVWLKGNSKLNYPLKFMGNMRGIDLEGEALFEIAKDPAHPFVIHCGGLTTKVLGTSFNIKSSEKKIEVKVLTGRVFLSSENSSPIVLHPYQKAVYSASDKVITKATVPVLEVASLTRGTSYNMSFNDARVQDVLERVEKKFDVHITVKNQRINDNRITADFTDLSLEHTIHMMSEVFNLEFQIEGQSVTLGE